MNDDSTKDMFFTAAIPGDWLGGDCGGWDVVGGRRCGSGSETEPRKGKSKQQ